MQPHGNRQALQPWGWFYIAERNMLDDGIPVKSRMAYQRQPR
jgi:hypothetical protein